MPRVRLTHEECRRQVCVGCGIKTTHVISAAGQKLYAAVAEVPWDDPRIPLGLCLTCVRALEKLSQGLPSEDVPRYRDFQNVVFIPRDTRSTADAPCVCLICLVHYPGGLGKVSPLTDPRALKRGKHGTTGRPKKVRAEEEREVTFHCTPPQPIIVCPRCLTPNITEGDGHPCHVSDLIERMKELVAKHQTKVGEAVASSVLKSTSKSPGGTQYLSQHKGGPKVAVGLGKVPEPEPALKFSAVDMADIQKVCGIKGTSGIKKLGTMLNKRAGKYVVESNLGEKLVERGTRLMCHYTVTKDVIIGGKPWKVVHTVDLEALVCEVAQLRGVSRDDLLVRLGMDKGQGALKISFNLIDLSATRFQKSQKGGKARVSRPLGEFLDSGVEKLLLAAKVEKLEESHESVRVLFNLIKLSNVKGRVLGPDDKLLCQGFVLSADHKLINLALGLMSHSSTYPCSWCDAHKNSLDSCGKPRTFGKIRELALAFQKSKKNEGKDFKCCVEIPSLGLENPDDEVIDLIPPGQLHLLLGVVNRCIKEIEKEWPGIEKWFERLHFNASGQHGGKFDGNDCKRMSKAENVDILETMAEESNVRALIKPFTDVLRCMDAISHACFGNVLDDDYKVHLEEFERLWKATGINWFPLAHALRFHVPQFCDRRDLPLGPFSEQAGESLHHVLKDDWDARWKKLPKGSSCDPDLRAVVAFSSERI